MWLEDRGAKVTVVDHHEEWYQQLKTAVLPGTKLLYRAIQLTGNIASDVTPGFFDCYVAAINDEPDESFDFVIVDGRVRFECVRRAMPKVKRGGLLLLDDADRKRYKPAVALLDGWEQHDFTGLKPGDEFPAQTSVWRRPI